MDKKHFVTTFLFTADLEKVYGLQKDTGACAGKWTGLGCEINPSDGDIPGGKAQAYLKKQLGDLAGELRLSRTIMTVIHGEFILHVYGAIIPTAVLPEFEAKRDDYFYPWEYCSIMNGHASPLACGVQYFVENTHDTLKKELHAILGSFDNKYTELSLRSEQQTGIVDPPEPGEA